MSAPHSKAVDIARRSEEEVISAVHRWTDSTRSTTDGVAGAEPADPHSFLNEFFGVFESVLTRQREIALRQLDGDGAGPTEAPPPAGTAAGGHDRFADADDDDDRSQETAALGALAAAFATLVQALVTQHEVAPMSPRRIIQLAVDCMPRVRHAALIAVQNGTARTVAATPDLPDRIDDIRSATGQGPGLDVLDRNELVVSNDLAADPRWSRFGRRLVDELDIRSVVSYRLYLGPDSRAALSLYSDWPYAFDNLAITTGAIFAAYCSLATFNRLPHRPNRPSGGQ
jgi:hypothetical protein